MTTPAQPKAQASQGAAQRYAALLEWGTRIGLGMLVISFTGYLTGLLPPQVPVDQLPQVWNLSLKDYLQTTGIPSGWGWLPLVKAGDVGSLLGIAVLAGCSLPPLLGVLVLYIKEKDFIFAGICLGVIAVILLAASGVLTQGH